jgi:hypothetical protein
VRPSKKRAKNSTLIPDALLGLQAPKKQRGPETPNKLGAQGVLHLTPGSNESDINRDGKDPWYPQFYEMKTSDEVQQKAQDLWPLTSGHFKRLNHAVATAGHKEKEMEKLICKLGNHVRARLSRNTIRPSYGAFLPRRNRRMANVSRDNTSWSA